MSASFSPETCALCADEPLQIFSRAQEIIGKIWVCGNHTAEEIATWKAANQELAFFPIQSGPSSSSHTFHRPQQQLPGESLPAETTSGVHATAPRLPDLKYMPWEVPYAMANLHVAVSSMRIAYEELQKVGSQAYPICGLCNQEDEIRRLLDGITGLTKERLAEKFGRPGAEIKQYHGRGKGREVEKGTVAQRTVSKGERDVSEEAPNAEDAETNRDMPELVNKKKER